jgi:hypothetical protein
MISKVDRAKVTVHYVGFRVSARARKYTFEVRQDSETREFTLFIRNEAFASSKISFQDAPGFCSEKIHRELAAFANDPPRSEYTVTDLELAEYRDAHALRSRAHFHPPKPAPGI